MKHVLITGGSRGVGLALCRQLLADGWRVTTVSRSRSAELDALGADYPETLRHIAADLSLSDDLSRVVVEARLLDGVDGFVANAAVGTEGLLALTSERALRECVEVNLVSVMLMAREVVKGMLGRGGSLVFVSSVAATTGLSGLSVYSATKGALVSFSRSLAREYGERGIRSNCVLPGFLETEMSSGLGAAERERVVRRTALKRLGQPEDVVGALTFLLSDASRYVTGTELVVDGGLGA